MDNPLIYKVSVQPVGLEDWAGYVDYIFSSAYSEKTANFCKGGMS
ncbi:unnamed protein product, partial [marine sediment metagenome]